jgi:hypothetical protein
MSRAFVKESDSTASGSLVDRFYQGLLGLSDPARALVGKRQQQAWFTSQPAVEAARRAALSALGPDSYREIFESAAERAGDPVQSPTWWATGDAAVALAARRHLTSDQYAVLVGPLGVAFPWLKESGNQTRA